MNGIVILSGGSGVRFGGEIPKQYKLLNGSELIAYPIAEAKRAERTDALIVAADGQYAGRISAQYGVDWVQSGDTHNQSVKNALDAITERHPDCRNVLFLDAVRPLVTAELIDNYFAMLDDYDGVITAQKITDSLGYGYEMFMDRTGYFLIQKPEAFRFGLLRECFKADSSCTAIVQQLPKDSRVMKHFDFRQNVKITYPEDLVVAKAILDQKR